MNIEDATLEDAAEILALQRLAYQSEAEIHNAFDIPPLTQTLAGMREDFDRQVILKVAEDERIIGSVRAFEEAGTCHVGRLIVHPDVQNRGIGTRLMVEIEGRFAGAQQYELFTGHKSERALHLYNKLGYRPFRQEWISDTLTLVYLRKPNTFL